MTKIVLASGSPRRKQLLTAMGLDFEVRPSNFDEKLDDGRPASQVAIDLALGKATSVAKDKGLEDALIIASDTIVLHNGKQLGKPADINEARQTLRSLAGDVNEVTSSLVVLWPKRNILLMGSQTTKVKFKPLDEMAIDNYLASGDALDKAGSYGLQSGAAPLVEYIDGDFDVVVGLPTKMLRQFLLLCDLESKAVNLKPPVKSHHSR